MSEKYLDIHIIYSDKDKKKDCRFSDSLSKIIKQGGFDTPLRGTQPPLLWIPGSSPRMTFIRYYRTMPKDSQ